MSTSISLSSGNNYTNRVPILQSSTSEGKHNLGAWLAPDGNNKADLEILCSKGRSMSMHIAVSQLKRHEVAIAYRMMLRPAMKYTLSSTTLTTQECTKVDRSYLPTLLSWMGINRCTKQTLRFGPPSLGALGFTNTCTDQGIAPGSAFAGSPTSRCRYWKAYANCHGEPSAGDWISPPLAPIPSHTGPAILFPQLAPQCIGLHPVHRWQNTFRKSLGPEGSMSQRCIPHGPVHFPYPPLHFQNTQMFQCLSNFSAGSYPC